MYFIMQNSRRLKEAFDSVNNVSMVLLLFEIFDIFLFFTFFTFGLFFTLLVALGFFLGSRILLLLPLLVRL